MTIIWKATECICLNFHKLSITFSSWKQCIDSWFTVQLIGTSGKKVGQSLPKNFPPTPNEQKAHFTVWRSQPWRTCLAPQYFFLILFLPYVNQQVFVCFGFEYLLQCKWKLCLASACFCMTCCDLNTAYITCLLESCLYPWYLSESSTHV